MDILVSQAKYQLSNHLNNKNDNIHKNEALKSEGEALKSKGGESVSELEKQNINLYRYGLSAIANSIVLF